MWFWKRKPPIAPPLPDPLQSQLSVIGKTLFRLETLILERTNKPQEILKELQKMSAATDSVKAKLEALDAKVTAAAAALADLKNQLATASTTDEVNALGAQVDAIAAKLP